MSRKKSKNKQKDPYKKYAEIGDLFTSRWRKLDLLIPSNFRLLCAILQVKPEQILKDFMWKASYSAILGVTKKQQKTGERFFLEAGFGQPTYSKEDIKRMFSELKSIRKLCDTTESMKDREKELFWKSNHMYIEFWYKRWFEKKSGQDHLSVLEEY